MFCQYLEVAYLAEIKRILNKWQDLWIVEKLLSTILVVTHTKLLFLMLSMFPINWWPTNFNLSNECSGRYFTSRNKRRHIFFFLIIMNDLPISIKALLKKWFCQFISEPTKVNMAEPIFELTFLRLYLLYVHIFFFEGYIISVFIKKDEATNVNIELIS